MNRRSFFQLVTGLLAGTYTACVPKVKRDMQATEIKEVTYKQAEKIMRKEWRGEYDKNLAIAKKACRGFGGEPFNEFLENSNLGNDPETIRAFYSIGRANMEV